MKLKRAISSVVERCPDKTEIGGSIPPLPTHLNLFILFIFLMKEFFKKLKIRLSIFLGVLGPGVISAVADNDSAGIATNALAGARFGYSILFVLTLITILSAIIQEISTRIGVTSGKGLGSHIRERYGIRVALPVFLGVFIINLSTVVTNFYGLQGAVEILKIPRMPVIILFLIISITILLKGNFEFIEKIFLFLIIFFFSFIISAFKASVDWKNAFINLVFPISIGLNVKKEFIFTCLAALGTTVTPWELFLIGSSYIDKKIAASRLKYAQIETYFGVFLTSFFLFFIVVTTAATLYVNKIPLQTGEMAALAIKPFAGRFAGLLFAVGLLNAAIMGIWMVTLANSYLFSEMFGYEGSLDASYQRGKIFYIIFIFQILLAAILTSIPGLSLFKIVFYTQALNAFFLPLVIYFLLKFVNDREIVGNHTNTKLLNYITTFCSIVIVVATVFTIIEMFC